ncbi:MAG: hypothetical protein IKP95_08875 [Ruminococcus sp.]|nr:hypothetical protein [Ruminococcus sp.]
MEQNKETLTEMDKARELFEYEMTSILATLHGTFDNVGKDITSEYLEMEIEQPNLEYTSPEIALTGIGYEQPEAKNSIGEAKLEAGSVSFTLSSELPSADKVSIGGIGSPVADYSSVRAAITAETASHIEQSFAAKLADVFAAPAEQKKIDLGVKVAEVKAPVGFEIPKTAEKPSVGISVPAADITAGFELSKVDKPTASISPLPSFSEASALKCVFELIAPEITGFGVDSELVKEKSFAVPELPSYTFTVPERYDVPEKPDFSAFYDDVLDALRAEI